MNKKEREILTAFSQIPYMTAQNVVNLGIYSQSSEKFVKSLLKRFHDDTEPYLLRAKRDNYPSAPFIYWLAAAGRKMLRAKKISFNGWYAPSEMEAFIHSDYYPHYDEVLTFAFYFYELQRLYPQIIYEKFHHQFQLNRLLQKAPLIPDLYVKFATGEQPAFWLEWDRGTESSTDILKKIKALKYMKENEWNTWSDSPFENIQFLFATPVSEDRAKWLLREVQNNLYHETMKRYAQHFAFCYIPKKLDARTVFFDAIWLRPYSSEKTTLLDL